jgi:excisionase family DNA binding protein
MICCRGCPPPALAVHMDLADSLAQRATALTVSDVASLLNISERQVYKLAADGRIPCFKIGNSIRFDPAAFAEWLRQKIGPVSVDAQGRARARRA